MPDVMLGNIQWRNVPVGTVLVVNADGSLSWQAGSGAQGPQGPAGPKGDKGDTGNAGSQGPQGNPGTNGTNGAQGQQGPQGNTGPQGPAGPAQGFPPWVLLHPLMAPSAVATNLAANTFNAVSDPNLRLMGDLRGLTKVRIMGRIGGSLVAATRLRVQYHTGGNPNVATGDAGWTTLADTAGSHVLAALFYSAEIAVPAGAQVNNVLLRVGLFGGDGAADPTISACALNFYP